MADSCVVSTTANKNDDPRVRILLARGSSPGCIRSEVVSTVMPSHDPFGWVGSIIDGQFAVQAIAGQGGFGTVYRGTHRGLDVPVAIKCLNLPTSLSQDEQESFLANFHAEAKLLHQLSRQTANIVQALDIGAATAPNGQWTPYIVMEWLEGETLDDHLDARRTAGGPPQGLDAAIRILGPAAAALGIAHRNNVSHRDVKPANLFLWRAGGNAGMKVLDFGIAKVFSETPSLTLANALTSAQNRAFTPSYGAPEQFSLTYGATGPWTDVFAMALILIEVASGRRVLHGETVADRFTASIQAEHRPDLLQGVAADDSQVALVLRRALALNPATRFQSMDALWSAIDEARRRAPEPLETTVASGAHVRAPSALLSTVAASAQAVLPGAPKQSSPSRPLRIFCGSAPGDAAFQRALDLRLAPLARQGLLTICSEGRLLGGDVVVDALIQQLSDVDIALFLLSADLLADPLFTDHLAPHALTRQRSRSLRLVPVLIRPVDFSSCPFADLRPLPSNGTPISRWSDQDEAWLDVLTGLRRVMDALKQASARL